MSPVKEDISEAGFTLIEVLVALSIFAIAAVAIVQLTGQTARTAVAVEGRALAAIAADNAMVEAVIDVDRKMREPRNEVMEVGRRRFAVARRVNDTPNPLVVELVITVEELGPDDLPSGNSLMRRAFREAP